MDQFNEWFETFLLEKGINRETVFEIVINEFWHYIPLEVILEVIKQLPQDQKEVIKDKIVKIDFVNGDVYPLFEYLAKGVIQLEGL